MYDEYSEKLASVSKAGSSVSRRVRKGVKTALGSLKDERRCELYERQRLKQQGTNLKISDAWPVTVRSHFAGLEQTRPRGN